MFKILLKMTCIVALFVGSLSLFGQTRLKDPAMVVGPNACGECHKDETNIWKETSHAEGFFETHRMEEARTILTKLGSKRGMKRDPDCKDCHYTSMIPEGKDSAKPEFGISCESCHGAARDWIDIHNDYGGKDVKREEESPEHKAKRLADSAAKGMIRPDDIYAVAQNCYSCHTVPNQRIVNQGGHTAGSDFNLVTWSQGEIRHNFFSSADGKTNQEAKPERLRMMYLVGSALDLEFSLRSVAKATEAGPFATSMAKRVLAAKARLEKIQAAVNLPEVAAMIEAASKAGLKFNNEAQLTEVADQVATQARKLSAERDGSGLAGLDALIPGKDQYKGKPAY